MSIIERVARSIARFDTLPHHEDLERSQLEYFGYMGMARAAVLAMRDPSQNMLVAGEVAVTMASGLIDQWRVMIDAALRDEDA
jgi:hypothetical protein